MPLRKLLPMTFVMAFAAGQALLADSPNSGAIYHLFVRSFADGPDDDNTPIGRAGDLKGILEKLDYLNDGKPETDTDLEIAVLWLSPIFPATSYHGYDVENYREIDPLYGSLATLRELAQACHARGMKLILDLPINHTSRRHPWFLRAIAEPMSRERKLYVIEESPMPAAGRWHTASAGGRQLRYLGLFDAGMPDLNFAEPMVRQEVKAIAKFWLDQGVDGFRLDAAKHIFGATLDRLEEADIKNNNVWWQEFSDFVYQQNPNAILVGEVLGDHAIQRKHADGLDGLVNEAFMNITRKQVVAPKPGFLNGHLRFLASAAERNRLAYRSAPRTYADLPFRSFLFLASHDRNPRLASDLEQAKQRGMVISVDQAYRLAMTLLLTLGDPPMLYQGDELMQRGWKWNGNRADGTPDAGDGSGIYDETLREPFPWYADNQGPGQTRWTEKGFTVPVFEKPNDGISVAEQQPQNTMLSYVRALGQLRKQVPALRAGALQAIPNDTGDWMVFERAHAGQKVLVLVNASNSAWDYRFHEGWLPKYRGARRLFLGASANKTWQNTARENLRITDQVNVPPTGVVVLEQEVRR